jgi:hypothetical protein
MTSSHRAEVGSEAWRQRHLTCADRNLDDAEVILSRPVFDSEAARANALINLARARYRAVEVADSAWDLET